MTTTEEFFKDVDGDAKGNGSARPRSGDRTRFRFTPFREIVVGTLPSYTVAGLIPRLGVVVIWGKPKCGKTFWTFDLEMHVALDWPYRGHRVEQGVVLHIACEGVAGLGARKEAWRQYHVDRGYDADELDDAPFYLTKETTLDLIQDVDAVTNAIAEQFDGPPDRDYYDRHAEPFAERFGEQRRGHDGLHPGRRHPGREIPVRGSDRAPLRLRHRRIRAATLR